MSSTSLTSSQPTSLAPTPQATLKPCQRSCKGLMLYFPPPPQQEGLNASTSSFRSSEPVCFGLSKALSGPTLNLAELHEARAIPAGQSIDVALVFGHAVYQTSNASQVLPPGCMSGVEFLRFSKPAGGAQAALSAPPKEEDAQEASVRVDSTPSPPNAKGPFGDFRLLTSSPDANARINRTLSRIAAFDVQQCAQKLQMQAYRNLDGMAKWLQDLHDAVTGPPKA